MQSKIRLDMLYDVSVSSHDVLCMVGLHVRLGATLAPTGSASHQMNNASNNRDFFVSKPDN